MSETKQENPADVVLLFDLDKEVEQRITKILLNGLTSNPALVSALNIAMSYTIDDRIRAYLNDHINKAHTPPPFVRQPLYTSGTYIP